MSLQLKIFPRFPTGITGTSPIKVSLNGLVNSISIDPKALGAASLGTFLVANLPVAPEQFSTAFAADALKVGEAAGLGTGALVYFSLAKWRIYSTDAPVTA